MNIPEFNTFCPLYEYMGVILLYRRLNSYTLQEYIGVIYLNALIPSYLKQVRVKANPPHILQDNTGIMEGVY